MKRSFWQRWALLLFVLCCSVFGVQCPKAYAQLNTDRLMTVGRSALYYEDYVLSIQYFNQAISAKPYLYEPWYFRAIAKFYLDDFAGAEADCTQALDRNPYVVSCYELRGLCRIRLRRFSDAVSDYTRALRYDPENQGLWFNRVLCHVQDSDYVQAHAELDTMLVKWKKYAKGYALKGEVYMLQKDTASAIKAIDESLAIDPYDGPTWAGRSIISLARQEWAEAETFLDKAIHLMPKNAGLHINRALARYHQNNLRGAMADYDTALDYDPNNFLGHYNRGLLRAQVGDDNRGIEDFDFVLNLEPDNMLALFNRALLRDKTGDVRGAISDYSKVIEQYPNFWTGLQYRARSYRRLGMNKQAELDEFRVLKAQMEKRNGGQQTRAARQTRKRSDEDLEKYNQLVVADEQDAEHEYKSEYRGRVQDRKVDVSYLPLYELALERAKKEVQAYMPYDRAVDEFNAASGSYPLYVSNSLPVMNEAKMQSYFACIDSLGEAILKAGTLAEVAPKVLLRAVAYSAIQNLESAIDDLSTYLQIDSTSALAYWQRAVCRSKLNDFEASQGTTAEMKWASVLIDLTTAIRLSPSSQYLYYNRGNIYLQQKNYAGAIDDYTRALELDSTLAEAYYNRGLAYIDSGETAKGVSDLSKAGELGLYTAYSIIKKHTPKTP